VTDEFWVGEFWVGVDSVVVMIDAVVVVDVP
jgi:hypothetical protein